MAEITRSALKAGRWTYTAEELDRMCAEAAQRGDDELRCKPQARSVRYEQETGQVWIELNNGCTLVVPTRLLQGLRDVAPRDLKQVKIMGPGLAIEWPRLDMQFTMAGLLAGVFGTRAWMEELRRGGDTAQLSPEARIVRTKNCNRERPRKIRVQSRSRRS
jgi:hypothetical protein